VTSYGIDIARLLLDGHPTLFSITGEPLQGVSLVGSIVLYHSSVTLRAGRHPTLLSVTGRAGEPLQEVRLCGAHALLRHLCCWLCDGCFSTGYALAFQLVMQWLDHNKFDKALIVLYAWFAGCHCRRCGWCRACANEKAVAIPIVLRCCGVPFPGVDSRVQPH
jgi:hypothetical protein